MPSEKAKGNKALVATCVACQKSLSTEVMVSLTSREDGRPKQFTVCIPCANGGWRPPGFSGVHTFREEYAPGVRAPLQRPRNASQPLRNKPRPTGWQKEKCNFHW